MDIDRYIADRRLYSHIMFEAQGLWRLKSSVAIARTQEETDKINAYITNCEERILRISSLEHLLEFKELFVNKKLNGDHLGISELELDSLIEYGEYLISKKKERGR